MTAGQLAHLILVMTDMTAFHRALETRRAPPYTSARKDRVMPHAQQQLASQFVAGDHAATQQVIDANQPRLRRLVVRMLGWQYQSAVDDIVQEIFLRALESRHRFNGSATLETWLTSIGINQCRAFLRKNQRRQILFGWWQDQQTATSSPAAEQHTEHEETGQQVREAIAKLSTKNREVIVLHYFEHQTIEQVAGLIGISVTATTSRLNRARQALREYLDETILED